MLRSLHLNVRFFEKSVFAIADEYCKINLSRDLVPDAVCRVTNGKIYSINEEIGLPENARLSEIIRIWSQFVLPQDRKSFLDFWNREELLRKYANGENHLSINYWIQTEGNAPMRAEDHLAMFQDGESGDVLAVNYVLDRTEHYHLEQYKNELEQKNRQLDAMLKREREYQKQLSEAFENTQRQLDIFSESISGGMKISRRDPDFSMKYVSKQFASMLGYASPEALMQACGGSFVELVHPDEREQAKRDAEKYYAGVGNYSVALRLKCRDGGWKYVENHGRRVVSANGEIEYWNLMVDKHELVTKSIDLEAARQANEAKTEFLSRMSHDIRTPLNGILGLLDQADRHPEDAKLLAEIRRKAHVVTEHLLELLNDALELNQVRFSDAQLPVEALDLNRLLAETKAVFLDCAKEKQIDLHMPDSFALDHPYVWGSEAHVRQILSHILSNAVKYNRPQGSVWVTADQKPLDAGVVQLSVQVKDSGVGMSPEFLSQIYEPFAQERKDARSEYAGNGLGLPIVKGLLDRMNGAISIQSALGQGTLVEFSIPFQIAPQPQAENAAADLKGLRALLAEDNELNLEIVKYMLEDAHAEVIEARNGAEAVERFEAAPVGGVDVILMDVMMPEMDGLAAAAAIRRLDRPDAKQIPIIAMTANAFQEDVRRCIQAGMNAHLAKPLRMDKVFSTIDRLCRAAQAEHP